jgi:hypothetical protein
MAPETDERIRVVLVVLVVSVDTSIRIGIPSHGDASHRSVSRAHAFGIFVFVPFGCRVLLVSALCVSHCHVPRKKSHVLLASRYDLHLHRFGRAVARSGRRSPDSSIGGHEAAFMSSITAAAATDSKVSAHLWSSRVKTIFCVTCSVVANRHQGGVGGFGPKCWGVRMLVVARWVATSDPYS